MSLARMYINKFDSFVLEMNGEENRRFEKEIGSEYSR